MVVARIVSSPDIRTVSVKVPPISIASRRDVMKFSVVVERRNRAGSAHGHQIATGGAAVEPLGKTETVHEVSVGCDLWVRCSESDKKDPMDG